MQTADTHTRVAPGDWTAWIVSQPLYFLRMDADKGKEFDLRSEMAVTQEQNAKISNKKSCPRRNVSEVSAQEMTPYFAAKIILPACAGSQKRSVARLLAPIFIPFLIRFFRFPSVDFELRCVHET